MIWQLAEAKNKLSEVVTLALTEGPQRIKRRDQTVVVISQDEYESLKGNRPSLVQFILDGPDLSDLDLERDRSPIREYEW
jgi:antitoxin Phd